MVEIRQRARFDARRLDADVMITVAFSLEVFLLGLAAAVFIAREARTGRAEAGPASANVNAAKTGPRVNARAHRAVRGVHS
jgi:hypothetical protein